VERIGRKNNSGETSIECKKFIKLKKVDSTEENDSKAKLLDAGYACVYSTLVGAY